MAHPKKRKELEEAPVKSELKPSVEFLPHPKWTAKQRQLLDLILNPQTKCVIISGPAGTSKTMLAVYAGLLLLDKDQIEDILYLRTVVESAYAHIGFLPGDVNEKLSPYGAPLHDKLEELLTAASHRNILASKAVNAMPINFIRGSSWRNKLVIADEAQNEVHGELKTILTRLGEGSKILVLGDPGQTDLPHGKSGFVDLYNRFDDEDAKKHGVHTFSFGEEDIVRSAFCRFVCSRLN